jgi:hypothetical protein
MHDDSEPPVDVAGRETPECRAVIQRFGGRPNRCTIYLAAAVGEPLLSAWISADEGSYAHLNAVR